MAEEKKIATGHIGNALRSSAANHTTTFADEIFDTDRQKYQNEVNTELEAIDNEIKADLEAETVRAKAAEEANAQAIDDVGIGCAYEDDTIDASIADENGNVLVDFSEGHIKTKNFNSKNIKIEVVEINRENILILNQ